MLWVTLTAAATAAYYPAADVRLDCARVQVGVGTTVNGRVTSPGGGVTVEVSNVTEQASRVVDPIVFAGGGVTVCRGSVYVGERPRWCTEGDVTATWICESLVDSSECWTQNAQGARTLNWRQEYAVTWRSCGDGCVVAVSYDKPEWVDDVLALVVCGALLAIAIAAPHVIGVEESWARGLVVNWASAATTLAAMHERLPLQPLWTHGLLAATAAATAATVAARGEDAQTFEPLMMALIAATLPARSLGESAVRIVRFVIGLGLCVMGGYWPSPQAALGGGWAAAATIYPIVVTATGVDDVTRDVAITATVAVSAAVAGWASKPQAR